jgi:exodeoxyribonuclease VII small subunit
MPEPVEQDTAARPTAAHDTAAHDTAALDTAAQDTAAQDTAQLGYEQARDALIDVVRRLEAGNLTLEESLALWERGEALAEVCRQRLEGARARLAEVTGEG